MSKQPASPPKKLAFVSDAIYPYNKGGKETRLFQITTRLAQKGYEVHVYTMQWWKKGNVTGRGDEMRLENGVYLHAICPLYPLYDGPRRSIKQGILFGLACLKLVKEDFEVVDVDHMPFFPLYAMRVVCWVKGKKMTATWHEVWGKEYWGAYLPGFKGKIASLIEQGSFKLPDKIISVSNMTTKRLKEVGYKGKIVTIPNGIDMDVIEAVQPSKKKSDIIYAGRLLKHKNVDVLIEAVALMKKEKPTVKCLIVGDGPELPRLKKQVSKLKLEKNVEFVPFQEDVGDVYALMKSSKVFVLPSEREGFGLVVLEANACGLPVVTVDMPGNAGRELVRKENGIVVKLNKDLIYHSILIVLSQTKQTFTPKEAQYSWEKILQQRVSQLGKELL